MHYIGVKDGKKRRQNKFQHCAFFNTIYFNPLALIGAEKSVTKQFIKEKEKNGYIKVMISMNFKILGDVVPKKSFTHTHTHTHTYTHTHTHINVTEKMKTIYPL